MPIPNPPYDRNTVYEIPLTAIEADDSWNCRGFIDPSDILDLARSINEKGLKQAAIVMPNPSPKAGKPFKLVAGYRRYRAHQFLRKEEIRVTVELNLTETDARVLNLTENLQRSDLNIKQEAHALSKLRNLTGDQIAARVNKSRGWVLNRMALLKLPDDIQDEAAAGVMTSAQVLTCSKLPEPDDQYDYIRKLKDARLRGKVRKVKPPKPKDPNELRLRSAKEIEEIQDIIRDICGGNNLTTRLLGWAAGHVLNLDMHKAIAKEAESRGKYYEIPSEYLVEA